MKIDEFGYFVGEDVCFDCARENVCETKRIFNEGHSRDGPYVIKIQACDVKIPTVYTSALTFPKGKVCFFIDSNKFSEEMFNLEKEYAFRFCHTIERGITLGYGIGVYAVQLPKDKAIAQHGRNHIDFKDRDKKAVEIIKLVRDKYDSESWESIKEFTVIYFNKMITMPGFLGYYRENN